MMRTSSGHPRREVLAGSALAAVVAIALTACSPAPPSAAFPTASAASSATVPIVSMSAASNAPSADTSASIKPTKSPVGSAPPRTLTILYPSSGETKEMKAAVKVVQEYFAAQLSRPSRESLATMRRLASRSCRRCGSDISIIADRTSKGRYTIREVGDPNWGSLLYSFRSSTGPRLTTVRQQYVQPPLKLVGPGGKVVGIVSSSETYTSLFVVDDALGQIVSRTPVG